MYNEAQKNATAKYQKENIHQVKLQINKSTEKELLAWINSQSNKQGYIKSLILADMQRKQAEASST